MNRRHPSRGGGGGDPPNVVVRGEPDVPVGPRDDGLAVALGVAGAPLEAGERADHAGRGDADRAAAPLHAPHVAVGADRQVAELVGGPEVVEVIAGIPAHAVVPDAAIGPRRDAQARGGGERRADEEPDRDCDRQRSALPPAPPRLPPRRRRPRTHPRWPVPAPRRTSTDSPFGFLVGPMDRSIAPNRSCSDRLLAAASDKRLDHRVVEGVRVDSPGRLWGFGIAGGQLATHKWPPNGCSSTVAVQPDSCGSDAHLTLGGESARVTCGRSWFNPSTAHDVKARATGIAPRRRYSPAAVLRPRTLRDSAEAPQRCPGGLPAHRAGERPRMASSTRPGSTSTRRVTVPAPRRAGGAPGLARLGAGGPPPASRACRSAAAGTCRHG